MLPTKEQADKIVEESQGSFYRQSGIINGFNYVVYNYHYVLPDDFKKHYAKELRGLMFIQDEHLRWNRHSLLEKFFNVDEYEDVSTEKLQKLSVLAVQSKYDGSIISFVTLPNGDLVARSMNSFTSDQAIMANELLKQNTKLHNWLSNSDFKEYSFIFELISPDNHIVVDYETTELVLLAVRNSTTGTFVSSYYLDSYANDLGVKAATVDKDVKTLNDVLLTKKDTGIEGYVITFTNNLKVKLKTDWYCELHHLHSYDAFKAHNLIECIINKQDDDLLSTLTNQTKKDILVNTKTDLIHYFNIQTLHIRNLVNELKTTNRKDFAIKHKNTLYVALVYKLSNYDVNTPEFEEKLEQLLKDSILRETAKQKNAELFLEGIKDGCISA